MRPRAPGIVSDDPALIARLILDFAESDDVEPEIGSPPAKPPRKGSGKKG